MYKSETSINTPQGMSKEQSIAESMAGEIISNWDCSDQNIILKTIRELVIIHRQNEIMEMEKKLEFLRGSLNEI